MIRHAILALGLATFAVPAQAKTLTLDTAKSVINWKGEKKLVDAPHHGTLKLKSGTLDRTKFDVKYNSAAFFSAAKLGDKIIKDELTVALDLVAK